MAYMETEEILKVLPHRYPMMLVDRVLECDFEAKRIVGIKNVSFGESALQGHFPGKPIMPGVLQLEAMAQLGGIMLNKMIDREGIISYFTGIDKVKFRKVIVPGDQMVMEVVLQRFKLRMAKVHGTVHVDGALACEADMSFAMSEAGK
ncbi:MAG: 3-hydroxyacyl-ACP dehydratase FabZ [Kiritimatiellae bacterium]|nr:3-hydroxyacyl-ACP dehydratase FabZ [Kiritimatiellia bacterium]MDD4735520.1 3-hydroxyacyl-ACP dehydratase FabZ [Kiritimatiellia bacterium]